MAPQAQAMVAQAIVVRMPPIAAAALAVVLDPAYASWVPRQFGFF